MVRAAAPKLAEYTADVDTNGTVAVAEPPAKPKKPRKKVAAVESVATETPATEVQTPVAESPVDPATVVEPAPAPATPDVDAILVELRELERNVAAAEARWDAAKRAAKDAHEIFDARVSELRLAIQDLNNDADRPLLKMAAATGDSSTVEEEATPARDWRGASIDELGLPAKLAEKLVENSITTIGELEDLRAAPGLTSIKGVGQGKADVIEEAVLAWLSKNRDAGAFAAATTTTEIVDAADAVAGRDPYEIGNEVEGGPLPLPSEEHIKQVLARVDEIEADPSYDASFRPESPTEHWSAGYQFYLDFESCGPEYCPHGPGSDQDEWLRGWLYNDYLCGDSGSAS